VSQHFTTTSKTPPRWDILLVVTIIVDSVTIALSQQRRRAAVIVAAHDFETARALDLRKTGVYPQVEHPSFRIWMMSWCLHDDQDRKPPVIHRWHPGDPDPVPLLEHVARGGIMKVHNATFERTVWNGYLRKRVCSPLAAASDRTAGLHHVSVRHARHSSVARDRGQGAGREGREGHAGQRAHDEDGQAAGGEAGDQRRCR